MRVVNLLQRTCPEKVPHYVGACLGEGADGEVREIPNDISKVVKYSIIYDTDPNFSLTNQYRTIADNLNYIKSNSPLPFVKVYDHGLVHTGVREASWGQQKYLIHYYVMEKLENISEDETKVFHSILSQAGEINLILKKLSIGLEFSEKEVMIFYRNLQTSKLIHNDIQIDNRGVRNIMKNNLGNFKLIDLDRLGKHE